MRKSELVKFKKFFENRIREVSQHNKVMRDDFVVSDDDKLDEVDHATADTEASVQLRLRNREVMNLKQLEDALLRIEEGTFGECVNCGEDIEVRRLEARPTATLCVACQEEEEKTDRPKAVMGL